MFKKLKDRIAEDLKISPQRITQAVTERLQGAPSEDNFFSIDDDASTSSATAAPASSGFTSVSLHPTNSSTATGAPAANSANPEPARQRRLSNMSLSSDVSFLPRYESATTYQLQSDVEASASEMEDNISVTSAQVGNVSKEQIHSQYQRARLQYHKYRGRYTDLTKHYKNLTHENEKLKSVLGETQDKAFRRFAELREQCQLEQTAKAHLENALRMDLDEKQCLIDTLKTKIGLLNAASKADVVDPTIVDALAAAKADNEILASKLQESKAQTIVFNSKEGEYKAKIAELDARCATALEKENEFNLKLAKQKMQLHTELQNKDLEINNLKSDLQAVKEDLDAMENRTDSSGKLEQFQSQNTKLIEKVEMLTAKCNNYEAELLKMEQLRQENRSLAETAASLKEVNKGFAQELDNLNYLRDRVDELALYEEQVKQLTEDKDTLTLKLEEAMISNGDRYSELNKDHIALDGKYTNLLMDNTRLNDDFIEAKEELDKVRADAKKNLLQLEAKITQKLELDYKSKTVNLKLDFDNKLKTMSTNNDSLNDLQMKLMQTMEALKASEEISYAVKGELNNLQGKFSKLELAQLDLIEENNGNRHALDKSQQQLAKLKEDHAVLEDKNRKLLESTSSLEASLHKLEEELASKQLTVDNLSKLKSELHNKINELEQSISNLSADLSTTQSELAQKRNQLDQLNSKLESALINQSQAESDRQAECADALAQCESFRETIKTLTLEKASLEQRLHDSDANMAQLSVNIETITIECAREADKLSEMEGDYKELILERDTYKEQCYELLQKVDAYDQVVQQSQLDSMRIIDLDAQLTEITEERDSLLLDRIKFEEQLQRSLSEHDLSTAKSRDTIEQLTANADRQKQKIAELSLLRDELQQAHDNIRLRSDEVTELNRALSQLTTDKQQLDAKCAQMSDAQRRSAAAVEDLAAEKARVSQLTNERDQLTERNVQLASDCGRLSDESDRLLADLEAAKLSAEEPSATEDLSIMLAATRAECDALVQRLALMEREREAHESLAQRNDEHALTLQSKITELGEMSARFEAMQEESRKWRMQVGERDAERDRFENQRVRLEQQVRDLDEHCSEIKHENQLLKDEVQELKSDPINVTSASHQNDSIVANGVITRRNGNNDDSETSALKEEVAQLREKMQQYKSIDLTNRNSIEFFEGELQRAQVRNEKLTRKLDETLVTLNHCSDLSGTETQVEYLRNVLFNYMLGREPMVLARVIATVCKFNGEQTDAVMKNEVQKQTLLAHLGLL